MIKGTAMKRLGMLLDYDYGPKLSRIIVGPSGRPGSLPNIKPPADQERTYKYKGVYSFLERNVGERLALTIIGDTCVAIKEYGRSSSEILLGMLMRGRERSLDG